MSTYQEPTEEDFEDLLHAQAMKEDFEYLTKKGKGLHVIKDLLIVFNFAVRIVKADTYGGERDEVINELEEFFR